MLVGENKIVSDLVKIQTYVVPRKEQIRVKSGDVVGWRHDGAGLLGWKADSCHKVRYYFVKPDPPPPPPPIPAYCETDIAEVITCESDGNRLECKARRPVCDLRVKEFRSKGDAFCQV